MRRRWRTGALAAAIAVMCAACHHREPAAQDATHAGGGAGAATPAAGTAPSTMNATGAMPVGSIKEDRGDIRYVNPTMQGRRDAGAPSSR